MHRPFHFFISRLREILIPAALAIGLVCMLPDAVSAADTGAVGDGNWSNVATWTNGVPSANGNAYIGSIYPTGAATTATVTLSQSSAAGNVYLGNGSGTTGALDLDGFSLSANNLYLGQNGGTASIQRSGGGKLSVYSLHQDGSAFSFAPADTVTSLSLSNGSSATTAAAGNIQGSASVGPGCTLALGTDLVMEPITTGFQSSLGLSGTLNANGHVLTAYNVTLSGLFSVTNRGPISTTHLGVFSAPGQTPFSLIPSDNITNLHLYGTSVNFPDGFSLGGVSVSGVNITLPQSLTMQNLGVGSQVTTSSVNNVTDSVGVADGGTLILGADMNLSNTGSSDIRGTLDARGHAATFGTLYLGWYAPSHVTIVNPGPINATQLLMNTANYTGPAPFTLPAGSAVTNLTVAGNAVLAVGARVQNLTVEGGTLDSVTTTAPDNLTASVYVDTGCTLTLGADLLLSNVITVRGATLNANGHALSSPLMDFWNLGGPPVLQNAGMVNAGRWRQIGPAQIRLDRPDDGIGSLALSQNSSMTIGDATGQTTGLTIGNPTLNDLLIDSTSDLALEVNGLASGWVFRWANPGGGDHIADLQSLINANEITFSYLNGGSYNLTADSSYTYVNVIPVPEPSTLLLSAAAAGLIAVRRRRKT